MAPIIKRAVDTTLSTFKYILTRHNADAWSQYRDCIIEQLKTGQTLLKPGKPYPIEA